MILSFFRNKRQKRSESFIMSIKYFKDDELKGAYSMLDSERMLHCREHTHKELRAVEEELNKRGFEHMKDY